MPDRQLAIQRAAIDPGGVRPVMLAIAGDSAAGKTTLTRGIVEALGVERVASVCVDDYHRYDREERKELPFTALHPDCNYMEIMEQHLQLLSLGQPILKPVYNHRNGCLDRPVLVEPRYLVVVEGLLPLTTKVARSCFDVRVYLDPPEAVRQVWKINRDTGKRGYTEAQVLAELARREPESAAFIRPQRADADIVVSFAPLEGRGESAQRSPSATILLRPTVPHPNLTGIITDDVRQTIHLKLTRDEDGRPVDAIHVHGYAPPDRTRPIEEAIWDDLGVADPLPESLGMIDGERSDSLALTQLILLYHVIQSRAQQLEGSNS
ncbi:MAG: phosphoribulokinase [Acidimicrobiia bacterium]